MNVLVSGAGSGLGYYLKKLLNADGFNRAASLKRVVTNKKYDVIIIGSGISGLTAGIFLAQKGRKVLILEKHFKVGGWTHTFKRKDYEWDVGIHYIGGMHLKKTMARRVLDKISNNNLKWHKMSANYDRIIIPDKSYNLIAPKRTFIQNTFI